MEDKSMHIRFRSLTTLVLGLMFVTTLGNVALQAEERLPSSLQPAPPLAAALGLQFVEGSSSTLILERDGKQYLVDLVTRSITENGPPVQAASLTPQQNVQPAAPAGPGAAIFQRQCAGCHGSDGRGAGGSGADLTRSSLSTDRVVDVVTNGRSGTAMQAFRTALTATEIRDVAAFVQTLSTSSGRTDIFRAADDFVYSLPTGRRVERGELDVNFSHRFAYNPAFSGRGLGNTLLGLDGFSISSFGFRYGVTDRLSLSVYRAPSVIGRPIELMAAFNVLDENDDQPFNAAFRVSIDGQDNFRKNFTTNFEGVFSRSITSQAQFYAAPTLSLENRRLITKPGALELRPPNLPGINSFSLGGGLAVNIRPSVSLVAEAIPTLVNGDDLGIHRPAYAFGIQKRVRGHAFTLGFSNGPGTVVAQRAGTRATFLGSESADTPSGLFIGFNLMRRLR
jgi:mono/diheme cytochrome c family protein